MFRELVHRIKEDAKIQAAKGEYVHLHIIEKQKGQPCDGSKKMESISISLPTGLDQETMANVQNIKKEVTEKFKSQIDVEIEQAKALGDKFSDYGEIKKVFGEGSSQLVAKEGQVLLVDVWATWCGPCQKPMAHNEEMLTKNQWGDKVRIVGVSVDDDLEVVRNRVETKGWKTVEHLCLEGWKADHALIKDFSISGIPFVCLVDTKGCINYVGHPSSISLEKRINELLTSVEEKVEVKQEESGLKEQAMNELLSTFSNEQWINKNFDDAEVLSFKLQAKSSIQKNQAEITAYCTERDEEVIGRFEKMLPVAGVKFEKKIIKEVNVPPVPNTCKQCEKELTYPLYWCKWNDDEFRCRQCVQKKVSSEEGYFAFRDNSVLLLKPTKIMPASNFGKNVQPADVAAEVSEPNLFGCNGCGECPDSVGTARFVCLNCRSEPNYYGDYCDYCETCINEYIDKKEQRIERMNQDGHNADHAYVRVLFNVKGYYEY